MQVELPMAGHVTFSQIRDNPSNDFENIYNNNLDNNVDDCDISPYDIIFLLANS